MGKIMGCPESGDEESQGIVETRWVERVRGWPGSEGPESQAVGRVKWSVESGGWKVLSELRGAEVGDGQLD